MAITAIRPQAASGIRFHQEACVYPCEFNTSFMPELAKATTGVGCAAGRGLDHGPQLALQLSRIGIDLPKLLLIADLIEQDTIIEVVPKQCTHSGRVGGRQEVGPDVF
jgi:hypothetical protein